MSNHYPFPLEPLPYDYDALVPVLDSRTLHFHHDKHLQTYVNNLNSLLEPYPAYHDWSLEKILKHLDQLPEKIQTPVRNNAGGVYNHQLYFNSMTRQSDAEPKGKLAADINRDFGSYEAWRAQMKDAALGVFGSGWAWLVQDKNAGLKIVKTPNQDTPLSDTVVPLLLVDVWEHAYYLQYQNLRANYVDGWFSLIDWDKVEARYQD